MMEILALLTRAIQPLDATITMSPAINAKMSTALKQTIGVHTTNVIQIMEVVSSRL